MKRDVCEEKFSSVADWVINFVPAVYLHVVRIFKRHIYGLKQKFSAPRFFEVWRAVDMRRLGKEVNENDAYRALLQCV